MSSKTRLEVANKIFNDCVDAGKYQDAYEAIAPFHGARRFDEISNSEAKKICAGKPIGDEDLAHVLQECAFTGEAPHPIILLYIAGRLRRANGPGHKALDRRGKKKAVAPWRDRLWAIEFLEQIGAHTRAYAERRGRPPSASPTTRGALEYAYNALAAAKVRGRRGELRTRGSVEQAYRDAMKILNGAGIASRET